MRSFAGLFAIVVAPLFAQAAVPLQKRESGIGSWFDDGMGACGVFNTPSDFIVALNEQQFKEGGDVYPGVHCFQKVRITHNGITQIATIMDECPRENGRCNYGDMDMSKGLFQSFGADFGQGLIDITWEYVRDGDNPQTTTPTPTPTPTPTSTSSTSSDPVLSVQSVSQSSQESPTASPLPNIVALNNFALMFGNFAIQAAEKL